MEQKFDSKETPNKYQQAFLESKVETNDAVVAAEVEKILKEHIAENDNKEVYQFLLNCVDLTTLSTTDSERSVAAFTKKVNDDLVFVIRGTAPNYQGVTVTWKGLLDIITAQATQAKNDAETAKNAYICRRPFTLLMSIVMHRYGRTAMTPLHGFNAFPPAMPNQANKKPDKPIVGSVTYIGSKDE